MAQGGAQRFADALQRFERDGDLDGFVDGVFTGDAELLRPEQEQTLRGRDGAVEFWRRYLAQFDEIRSAFHRVVDGGDLGVLEWRSEGRRANGDPIAYEGVSVIDLDAEGRVRRFATWFDTAVFLPGPSPTRS